MKKVLAGLEVNENDNLATAFAKGMGKGLIGGTVTLGLFAGTLFVIGKATQTKELGHSEEEGTEGL